MWASISAKAARPSRGYRLALAALRLSVVGLVLLMIAQVELFLQRTGLPFVVVIIDDTRSMNTVDRYDEDVRKSLEDRVAQPGRLEIARSKPSSFPAGTLPACSLRRTTATC